MFKLEISFTGIAQADIEESLDYCKTISEDVAIKFI